MVNVVFLIDVHLADDSVSFGDELAPFLVDLLMDDVRIVKQPFILSLPLVLDILCG